MKKVLPAAAFLAATLLLTGAAPTGAAPAAPGTSVHQEAAADSLVIYPVYGEPAVYSDSGRRGGIGIRGSFAVTAPPEGTVAYQYAVVPGLERPTEFPAEFETIDAASYTLIPVVPEVPGWQQMLVRPVAADGTPGSFVRQTYEVARPGQSPSRPAPAAEVDLLPIDLREPGDATAKLRVRMSGELFSDDEPSAAPRGEVAVRRGGVELGRSDVLAWSVAVEVPEDSLGTGSTAVELDYYPYPGAGPITVTGTVCLHECQFEKAWSRIYGGPVLEARVAAWPRHTSLTDIQWFRDGRRISGEAGKYLVTGPPDVGHEFTVRTTVGHPRMVPVTIDSPVIVPTRVPVAGVRYFVKGTNVYWSDGDGERWQVENGEVSGTTDPPRRNESVTIEGQGDYFLFDGYSAHVPGMGWIENEWNSDLAGGQGAMSAGTYQRNLDLEAYRVSMIPKQNKWYDVYYRSYVAPFGWMGWSTSDLPSGTVGYGFDVSAIQMVLREKGEAGPKPSFGKRPAYLDQADQNQIWSNAYSRDAGWSGGKPGGYTAGSTSGALEGVRFSVTPTEGDGGVSYRALVHGRGWTDWTDTGTAGAPNAALVEAYQLRLTGEIAERYDVYARSYVGGWGWLGWAKNGTASGSSGYDRALRATQVILVPKGQAWPTGSGLPRSYVR